MAKGYIVDTWDSESTARSSGYTGPLKYLDTGAVQSIIREFECPAIPLDAYLEATRLDEIAENKMHTESYCVQMRNWIGDEVKSDRPIPYGTVITSETTIDDAGNGSSKIVIHRHDV